MNAYTMVNIAVRRIPRRHQLFFQLEFRQMLSIAGFVVLSLLSCAAALQASLLHLPREELALSEEFRDFLSQREVCICLPDCMLSVRI